MKRDDWVEQHEIQIPDGLEGNRWVVAYEGKRYWLKTILDEQDAPARMLGSFREAVMPLRVTKEGYEVIRSEGEEKPQLAEPNLILGWKEQFLIRFGHDYPNEIFAYLFQAELARKINGEEPSGHPMTKKTMEWFRKQLK